MPRIEPGAAEWEAWTLPLCYAAAPTPALQLLTVASTFRASKELPKHLSGCYSLAALIKLPSGPVLHCCDQFIPTKPLRLASKKSKCKLRYTTFTYLNASLLQWALRTLPHSTKEIVDSKRIFRFVIFLFNAKDRWEETRDIESLGWASSLSSSSFNHVVLNIKHWVRLFIIIHVKDN